MDCWNEIHNTDYSKYQVELTWGVEFCDHCGQFKRIVVATDVLFAKNGYFLIDLFRLPVWLLFDGIVFVIKFFVRRGRIRQRAKRIAKSREVK